MKPDPAPVERPLDISEFAQFHEPAGTASARLEISGMAVELRGIPEPLAEAMRTQYAPYLGPVTGEGAPLRIEVLDAPRDYFVTPGFTKATENYRVETAVEGTLFRSASYRLASWFDVARGVGQAALAHGELDPLPRTMENFLRSAVAWLAMERGGFFLHGASIVRDGVAYLFYGPSGAGKSTLSALSDQGQVISDDLTLVVRRPEGLRAAGGPFRGTYRKGEPVVGLFPIAGFYRLRKDERTLVRRGDGACFADLLGNLPWVVDQFPRQPHLIDRVRALVEGLPFRYLHFRKDESFWPAIDADRRAASQR